LGQNVCSYRNPKSKILPTQRSGSRIAARIGTNPKQIQNPKVKIKNNDFSELLRRLVKIKGDFTISFMSPHPKDFSDELIDLIASEPKISKEIHLPLQSGDDKILRKMNRGYTVEQYLKLINKLELKIRGLRLSTDIIVGFPGEKEKNFRNTVKVVKDSYFAKAYISIYSPRPGTMADKKFKDTISASTKRERWLLLDKMINQKRLYKN
jgi:tRNA-2-methylthio-N6-dimethylallyladenosine synthase